MDPKTVYERRHDAQLLDVREDEEWNAGRIEGAVHIPLAQLPARLAELDRDRPVVTVCRSGGPSRQGEQVPRRGRAHRRDHGRRHDPLVAGRPSVHRPRWRPGPRRLTRPLRFRPQIPYGVGKARRWFRSTIETSSLGDRSYLANDGEVAVVIDPQRDIDRVLDLAAEHRVRITHVVETHVHNDYVTGGLELARPPARPTCSRRAATWSSTTPRRRRRGDRGRRDAAAGAAHPRAHPPPRQLRPGRHRRARCRRCSPAGRCSTAPPGAPTWSARTTPSS